MVGFNADGAARDRVLRLMEEKDRIESQIRDQNAVLESNNVGMQDPLVDEQGFPRVDIDVYKVRHARHQLICLQNDHKAIMKRIEQGLAEVHAQFKPQGQPTSSHTHANGTNGAHNNGLASREARTNGGQYDKGFAVVAFVHDGSPADLAGLNPHDEVLELGSVNAQNFSDISQIMDIVAHSVGQSIRVIVRRNNHVLNLNVTPRPWGQPGLLGCQINRLAN